MKTTKRTNYEFDYIKELEFSISWSLERELYSKTFVKRIAFSPYRNILYKLSIIRRQNSLVFKL